MNKILIIPTIFISFASANVDSLLKNECVSYLYIEAQQMNNIAKNKDFTNKNLTNIKLSKVETKTFLNTSFNNKKYFEDKTIDNIENLLNEDRLQTICKRGNEFNQNDFSKYMKTAKIDNSRMILVESLSNVMITQAIVENQTKRINEEKQEELASDFKSYYLSKLLYLTRDMSYKEIGGLVAYISSHKAKKSYKVFKFL